MKVFISWSGKKSKQTAELLNDLIRKIIQAAETWISTDIDKGTRWNDNINIALEEAKFGIICLNKDNLKAEWLIFEAGALAKTKDSQVCTFLLDVNPADIKPPLGQFQHTTFSKEDIRKLISSINTKILDLGKKGLSEADLNDVFETFWPKLESNLLKLLSDKNEHGRSQEPDLKILEEILPARQSHNIDIWLDHTLKNLLLNSDNLQIDLENLRSSKISYQVDPELAKFLIQFINWNKNTKKEN